MKDKKYQIFISSTYEDLKEERELVQKAILEMYHFPIGMEMFSAGDSEQWEIIKETIDSSDYYVLIIGHRYGSIDGEGISYTEKEYDYAKAKGIPTLAFIRDRNAPVSEPDRESSEPNKKKLDAFIDKAKKNMCDFWTSKEELMPKVLIALSKEFNRKPRPGWTRANDVDVSKLTAKLLLLDDENRKLREENDRLKQNYNRLMPEICLNINDSEDLKLQFISDEDFLYLRNDFEMLSFSDVPLYLKGSVTQEEIDVYNNNLPCEEEVDKYVKGMANFLRIKNAEKIVSFVVTNNGKAKANGIYITLRFPPEIMLIETDDLDQQRIPQKPEMPENPIDKAKKVYDKKLNPLGSLINKSYAFLNNDHVMDGKKYEMLLSSKMPFTKGAWLNDDNSITIKMVSLMHTRCDTVVEEFSLIPKKTGNYQIEIEIICEEYAETQCYKIPVLVK